MNIERLLYGITHHMYHDMPDRIEKHAIVYPFELFVFATPSKSHTEGWMYRMAAVHILLKKRVLCYDNHHGKCPHIDRLVGRKEVVEPYLFRSINETLEDFEREVYALKQNEN